MLSGPRKEHYDVSWPQAIWVRVVKESVRLVSGPASWSSQDRAHAECGAFGIPVPAKDPRRDEVSALLSRNSLYDGRTVSLGNYSQEEVSCVKKERTTNCWSLLNLPQCL